MKKDVIKRGIRFLKRRGFEGILEKLHLKQPKNEFLRQHRFLWEKKEVPFQEEEWRLHQGDEVKLLNWIIPEMGEGSGGHINIFRFISMLEGRGYHSRIYLVLSPSYYKDNRGLRNTLKEKFPILDDRVEAFWDIREAKFAHATIATSWQTAYYVRHFHNTISKFYFVQDYEPYFYPKGSFYQFAKDTYAFGLRGITAGDWLKHILKERHDMDCESFSFSYDKDLYQVQEKRDGKRKVFFYARPVTPRRCFEIGFLALCELTRRLPDVEVVFAGWDLTSLKIPFQYQDLNIVDIRNLSKVYGNCDLCMVLSATNLSLLPLEVMASGSVAVCSKGENSEWLVNEENSVLVSYDPIEMADTMEYYLTHSQDLERIRQKGIDFAKATSWEMEGEKVAKIIEAGILEDSKSLEK